MNYSRRQFLKADFRKELGKVFEPHIYVFEPHIYKDATHAFLEYQNLGENAKATADAWPRTIAFLKEHTKE